MKPYPAVFATGIAEFPWVAHVISIIPRQDRPLTKACSGGVYTENNVGFHIGFVCQTKKLSFRG